MCLCAPEDGQTTIVVSERSGGGTVAASSSFLLCDRCLPVFRERLPQLLTARLAPVADPDAAMAGVRRERDLARDQLARALELRTVPHARAAAAVDPATLLAALEPGIRRQVEEFRTRVAQQTAQSHRDEFLQRCALHQAHLARAEQDELQARLRELGSHIADLKQKGRPGAELEELSAEHLRLTEEKRLVPPRR